jgi:hypothetical protein
MDRSRISDDGDFGGLHPYDEMLREAEEEEDWGTPADSATDGGVRRKTEFSGEVFNPNM